MTNAHCSSFRRLYGTSMTAQKTSANKARRSGESMFLPERCPIETWLANTAMNGAAIARLIGQYVLLNCQNDCPGTAVRDAITIRPDKTSRKYRTPAARLRINANR